MFQQLISEQVRVKEAYERDIRERRRMRLVLVVVCELKTKEYDKLLQEELEK